MSEYATIDEWLDEIENYGTRRERVPEGALPWLEYAWKFGAAAEREACAKIADDMANNLELAGQVNPSNHINKAQLAARELSHRIRARGDKT